jgi:cytochrome c biogenesis protein CcdA/thiol-disulfide isomerase/thioredoxin
MLVLLAFAFVSGVITILSPCILPVLPIVLSGGVGGGRARPFGVLTGFVVSFTVFTLTLAAIVRALGIPADALRVVAVVLIALFGIVMLVPQLREGFERLTSRIASRGGGTVGAPGQGARPSGFASGIIVGLSLGLVWTPCVGPIMASVISLALTQQVNGGSVFITLAYTLGTSIPMLAVMLGGRALLTRVPALTRNSANIQKGFGVLMIVMAVAIGLGWDRRFQAAVLRAFPNYGTGLTAIEKAPSVRTALQALEPPRSGRGVVGTAPTSASGERVFSGAMDAEPQNGVLGDYGLAPQIVTSGMWFNTQGVVPMEGQPPNGGSPPLTMKELRGRVVLIDFWTYSCVNCVRTLPYLRAWYNTYRSSGFVIIGVHTPEFEFEMNSANVARAVKDLGVDWPVVQDNTYKEWNAYSNQYWPAHYFIDAKGRVRYFHFGEGGYDVSEKVIRELLKEAGAQVGSIVSPAAYSIQAGTPETYLGYDRGRGFASAVAPVADKPTDYTPARVPGNGEWNLAGTWTITPQYVAPETSGTLQLGFKAKNVFLVIQPEEHGAKIDVSVDGKPGGDTPDVKGGILDPRESRMYQLVALPQAGAHLLRLEVHGKLRLFAFTFG